MDLEDVWVIFNKQNYVILKVYAEEFLARRVHYEMIGPDGPVTGSVSNVDKLIVMTLANALREIELEHLAELQQKDWH